MNDTQSLAERFFAQPRLEDCPVYDLHGHMGPLQGARVPRCEPEQMIAAMDRAGVRLTVFCHHATLSSPDVGNEIAIGIVRRFPNRFRAYLGVNPNWPEDIRRDVDRLDDHKDVFVGFKFLADYHKVPITDERCAPAWEKANAEGRPVLLHTWGGSAFDGPETVRVCAERWPNAQILMGHSCHGQWEQAGRLAAEFPNVYCELTAVLDDRGAVEILLDHAGAEKIVFGTDTPWFNHHNYIGALLGARMSDEDRRQILYRNALRILAPFIDLPQPPEGGPHSS
ncbi:MAG: amidohydrolase family protein [Lentisphaeria bacterium]|nr:amidohydrolase family protein [Lentisphaeria bacterium]